MSGRVYLLGWGLALVAGAFLLTDALLWRPGLTGANVRRIRAEMTLEQVNGILGRPANYHIIAGTGSRTATTHIWEDKSGRAIVFTREDDERVVEANWHRANSPSPLARLRAWLGW